MLLNNLIIHQLFDKKRANHDFFTKKIQRKTKYMQLRGVQKTARLIYSTYVCSNRLSRLIQQVSIITAIIERERERKSAYYFLRSGQRRVGSLQLYGAPRSYPSGRPSSNLSWQDLSTELSPAEDAKARTRFHSAKDYRYIARASP